jgi:NADH/NAD ratio-sensing transcriptional regulator Rex
MMVLDVYNPSFINSKMEFVMDISTIKNIAVIGAGDMGHGIAEVALIAGYKVYLL